MILDAILTCAQKPTRVSLIYSGVTIGWLLRLVTGAPLVVGGPRHSPTVLEFLVINFSVCLVLLSNCYITIYCIVWFQVIKFNRWWLYFSKYLYLMFYFKSFPNWSEWPCLLYFKWETIEYLTPRLFTYLLRTLRTSASPFIDQCWQCDHLLVDKKWLNI